MDKPPFPGMDPYLEGEIWLEFHQTLAHEIRAQLMQRLPESYVALLERYYAVDHSGLGLLGPSSRRCSYPDVHVTRIKEAAPAYETFTAPAVELISPVPEKVLSTSRLPRRTVRWSGSSPLKMMMRS